MKKAFIFDMDGTLLHNIPFHNRAWMAFLENHGMPMTEAEMEAKAYGTGRDAMRRFFGQLTDSQADALIEEKELLYQELYRPHIEGRPGLLAFLEKTRALGVRAALGTAGDMGNVRFAIGGLGTGHFFEKTVSAEDVSRGKPDPEVFLKAAEKLGLAPADCVVFEDSESGLEAAHRAGMAAVAVGHPPAFFDEKKERWPRLLAAIEDFLTEPNRFAQMLDPQTFLEKELPELLEKLTDDHRPLWGKMTAQHMVEHLSGTVLISNGKFAWPHAGGTEWGRSVREAMFAPGFDDYPHHIEAPGVPSEPAALRFPDLATAKARFSAEIARFFDHFAQNPGARPLHPVFGELSGEEWMRAHMVHFRHHFKQFGLIPIADFRLRNAD